MLSLHYFEIANVDKRNTSTTFDVFDAYNTASYTNVTRARTFVRSRRRRFARKICKCVHRRRPMSSDRRPKAAFVGIAARVRPRHVTNWLDVRVQKGRRACCTRGVCFPSRPDARQRSVRVLLSFRTELAALAIRGTKTPASLVDVVV